MMFASLRSSLWAKILAVVLVSTFTALIVSTVALLLYEIYNYRSFVRSDLTTQASILARINVPALQFGDPEDANANLRMLENRQSIEAAAIYDLSGNPLATYSRSGEPAAWPDVGPLGEIQVGDDDLSLFHPIVESDNRLGTVYVRASYDLAERAWAYLLILVTVMGVGLIAAALISLAVMGSVTGPLESVTRIARRVIDERDFSHRAVRTSDDEIGVLVEAFNAMLGEVGERTAELENANRTLRRESETRRRAEAELREADRRKDEFLATLAHELRNPMAPMKNALSLLSMDQADPDTSRRGREILERQLAQLVRLVDDLLDVSRITSGKLTIRKERVELGEVVRSAVETVEPQLKAQSHTLAVDLPEDKVHLCADASRLAQVLANLLNNAIKFSEPGSAIKLSAQADARSVRIEVSDRGAGIAADALSRVFEMFSQESVPGEHRQSGLGVGLALARQLTQLHDGTIEGASEGPGRGATFTVTLPRAAAPAAAPPPDPAPTTPCDGSCRPTRVLLVDDNADFAASLAQLLGAAGHELRIANDGTEALVVARDFKPEFGILDIGLPDIDGHELARLLIGMAEGPKPVLIAISGWGQEEDRKRSLEAGFALHLVKPVDYKTIQNAMRELRLERRA